GGSDPAEGDDLMSLAEQVMERARRKGAEEVSVSVSSGTHVTLTRRGHEVEQATQATTRGLGLSLLAKDRFSSSSPSDLRPEPRDAFIARAVEATMYIEPDPFRRQPAPELCGRGVSEEQLDQDDPAWARRTADERAAQCERLETLLWEIGAREGGGIV